MIRRCQSEARLNAYGSLKPFLSFPRRFLASRIWTRRITSGSSPGLGTKELLCLEQDEEVLRGSLVLRALNAFLGAGTMDVVLLEKG